MSKISVSVTVLQSSVDYQSLLSSSKYFSLIFLTDDQISQWNNCSGLMLCHLPDIPDNLVLLLTTREDLVSCELQFGNKVIGYISCQDCTELFVDQSFDKSLTLEMLLIYLKIYLISGSCSGLGVSFKEWYNIINSKLIYY
jgi:hypothetical protein